MTMLLMELRLVLHSRLAAAALALLALLCCLSLWSGMREMDAQRTALARIEASQRAEVAAIADKYRQGGEAGYAGYSTPHLTTNSPSPLAFAAIGQRDLQPYSLRIRLLGLQAQLYESESVNPALAMAGRFDFAFVLVYLAPLFVIALMHDLVAGERESGRLRLIASLAVAPQLMWRRRIALRFGLVLFAMLMPLAVAFALAGAGVAGFAAMALAAALYLVFWFGIAAWVAAAARTAASSAAVLMACFVSLTMILPTLANAAIARMVPVAQGVELALAQRQQVHQGWDQPKADTLEKFFRTHPEWKDTTPVTGRFHWKWYYAMHQAGDDAVAGRVAAYRHSMQEREAWARRVGFVLAPVDVQVILHQLAGTDLHSQLAYRDRIASYHAALRSYFYPFIFNELAFGPAQFAALPAFRAAPPSPPAPLAPLLALAALAAAAAGLGLARIDRSMR